MPSSSHSLGPARSDAKHALPLRALVVLSVVTSATLGTSATHAQNPLPGFALERLYASAPGGGWLVMDALDMRGGLGAAVALSFGYERNPLRASTPTETVGVVSDRAFADWGAAVTYDRYRLYLNMNVPLLAKGSAAGFDRESGQGLRWHDELAPPNVDLGVRPDTIADPRIGIDARLWGSARDPVRLGAGAQVYIPSGTRADYASDETVRSMFRLLIAGDWGRFTYAGQLGLHLRSRDDERMSGWPRGTEQLFGLAAGVRLPLGAGEDGGYVMVLGAETWGATAHRALLSSEGSALEGLVTGRIESASGPGRQFRAKVAAGPGLHPHFGAPEWRVAFGVEVFDFGVGR